MTQTINSAILVFLGFLTLGLTASAAESEVPEPFRGFDDKSKYSISYDDLTAVLNTVVVDVGLSTRREAQEAADVTGTRLKTKVKKTANEGNRFYFETFDEEEGGQEFLRNIQKSLEQLPSTAPLKYFSRDEQLAYWLNLYNVTVLNEIIAVYPKKNLKKLIKGRNSIYSKKLLTVAGIPLSLNDIQYNILNNNYDNNPLIIYGLYQGIIGGPNIRKRAYTGATVYEDLESNAYEFINSNRGTYMQRSGTFEVSSLYDRNREYFPDFEADLTAHLSQYLRANELEQLQTATKIVPDIDDWSVTDLMGTHQRIGGSFATSRAALLDSMKSTVPMNDGTPLDGATLGASIGYGSANVAAQGATLARIDPNLLVILKELDDKRNAENLRNAAVTIEDLDETQQEPTPEEATDLEED
ncbi:MAG: DUF547 domain-containing protein [Woeseiaceae bacterium]